MALIGCGEAVQPTDIQEQHQVAWLLVLKHYTWKFYSMDNNKLNIDLSLPRGWHELNDKQLRYAFGLIAKGFTFDEIKTLCLFRWSGLSVRHRHNADFFCRIRRQDFIVSADQIAEVIPALDWLDTIPPQPVCISRIGRHRSFSPDFSEVPFEKFIICDNLYQGYLATQSDDLLDQLASILYQSPISLSLSPAERISAFYWFASVKGYFARRFHYFFQSSLSDNLLGSSNLPTGQQIQQSVDAMIRALTKGDITKEREILALDTHRALTELDAQAREYQEFNSKFPKK